MYSQGLHFSRLKLPLYNRVTVSSDQFEEQTVTRNLVYSTYVNWIRLTNSCKFRDVSGSHSGVTEN
jgi:hypothetical protein